MDITMDQVREGMLFLIALILSIGVHEFGHAWLATRLGDQLPRAQGRLTLNPIKHIDPVGTLLFPIMMIFFQVPLLGWGKPVQTNPAAYTRRFSRATGHMFVALAGPAMNLVMAFAVSVLIVVLSRFDVMSGQMALTLVKQFVFLNLSLLCFNLLPIPPLDGGAVLAWVLPRSLQYVVDFLSRWGFLILLGLMMVTPSFFQYLMYPASLLSNFWAVQVMELART